MQVWRAIVNTNINWKAPELRRLSKGARDFLQVMNV